MKELKEIRVDSGVLVLDGHRVLSPVIPRSYKDIDNDILVKGDGYIDGAVYARKLEVEKGPLVVCGALYTNIGLSSDPRNDQELFFHRAVASGDVIRMYDSGRKYFGADINAKRIVLRNAVVGASIFATEIKLENCVVLGGVFAGKSLEIIDSVVGTFNSPFASLTGNVYMLYPSVFTVEPCRFNEGSKLINLTLADWSNLMLGKPENALSGAIELNPEYDVQTATLEDNTLWQSYSVAGKVLSADLLDLRKLRNHFILSVGALQEQLVKTYDLGLDVNGEVCELTLKKIGDFFCDIQSGKIKVKAMDGTISFEELKKHYSEE